jgi:hypothetical protein
VVKIKRKIKTNKQKGKKKNNILIEVDKLMESKKYYILFSYQTG